VDRHYSLNVDATAAGQGINSIAVIDELASEFATYVAAAGDQHS
jgi:hypothetical protein